MMRRLFLPLFFAVLFLFGQQQAMVHGYVHVADLQQSTHAKKSSESKSTGHSEVCGKCVSLAGLGAFIGSKAHIPDIFSGQFQYSTHQHQATTSQQLLAYNSRAPPQISHI